MILRNENMVRHHESRGENKPAPELVLYVPCVRSDKTSRAGRVLDTGAQAATTQNENTAMKSAYECRELGQRNLANMSATPEESRLSANPGQPGTRQPEIAG